MPPRVHLSGVCVPLPLLRSGLFCREADAEMVDIWFRARVMLIRIM
jgi:hypothetical protein